MKVVDLHPEELLEKDARGELTDGERARLDAHLERCAACRFEREVRADFATELADERPLSAGDLVALVEGSFVSGASGQTASEARPSNAGLPAANVSERTTTEPVVNAPGASEELEIVPAPRRSTRPRRATQVWLLVAAALLVGGVAGAGVGIRTLSRFVGADEATVSSHHADDEAAPSPSSPKTKKTSATAQPKLEELAPNAPTTAEPAPPPPEPIVEPVVPVHAVAPTPTFTKAPVTNATVTFATPRATTTVESAPAPVTNVAPATTAAPDAPDTAASLFDRAADARRHGDHALALLLYRRLEATFPQSREAHVSFATMGQLLLDRGDARAALQSFDAYQARGSGALDEAVMVGRAKSLERLGRDADARAAWKALVATFPGSPYARLAEARGSTP